MPVIRIDKKLNQPGSHGSDVLPISECLKDLTGTINQRDQLEAAMVMCASTGDTLLIDVPVLVDTTVLEEIWVPTGLTMEWAPKGEIRISNTLRPGLIFFNVNVKLRYPKFIYVGPGLDAGVSPIAGDPLAVTMQVNARLKTRMATQYGVTFNNSMDPVWYGPNTYHATILLLGKTEVDFIGDFTVHSREDIPASQFCAYAITAKGQWKSNSVVNGGADGNSAALVDWPVMRGDRITLDGVLMGLQGSWKHLKLKELHSKRYSDMMGANGTNMGGVSFFYPPPHLIYFNDGTGLVQIDNVKDEGVWVTTHADPSVRRSSASGNCNSLKFMAGPGSYIGHVHCLRPDGMMDAIGGVTTSSFTINSFYAEYNSNLSDALFPCIRWPNGPYVGTKLLSGKIVDTAAKTKARPIGFNTDVNNRRVTIKNVEYVLNDIEPNYSQSTWLAGAEHDIDVTFRILAHTATDEYKGVIVVEGGSANSPIASRLKATVIGWRNWFSNLNLRNRMIINGTISGSTAGATTAEINDLTNGYTVKQDGGFRRERWTMKGIASAPNGASVVLTAVKIPANWTVVETAVATKTALGATTGCTGYTVGWSGTPAGIGTVVGVTTAGRIVNKTEVTSAGSDRAIVITPTGGNFDGTGLIEVNITCENIVFGE